MGATAHLGIKFGEYDATIAAFRTLLERMEAVEAMRRASRKSNDPDQ